MAFNKVARRRKIRHRIRNKVSGTSLVPRLSVFRSNKSIYCQLIDDTSGATLASASSKEVAAEGTKVELAKAVGKLMGERARKAGFTQVKFDRAGYLYHGRVQALADGAREAGLQF